jgi:CubicO group peptidase (beta-lactamase class C family)
LHVVNQGRLHLDESPSRYCSEWSGTDRRAVTIRHLLDHSSGLSARLHDRPPDTRRAFEHDICTMPLECPPGSKAIYSDLGFILLGFCVEGVGGASLASLASSVLDAVAQASSEHVEHAELLVTVPEHAKGRTAPTTPLPEDPRRGQRLIGEVHDDYAAALGGFAGHAGLFGSGPGVGVFARTVLTRSAVAGSSRALGWDTMLPTSSCGTHMTPAAFGHVGFTGTSLWIDPGADRYYVLLTNRVCAGGTSEDMQGVRRAFHNAFTTA